MRYLARCFVVVVFLAVLGEPALSETRELRISKQPGLQDLPLLVMEQNRLIEKHAQRLGLGNLQSHPGDP